MAKIFGLELKNVKVVTICFWADLYLNNKKIASCDYCGDDSPYVSVKWEQGVNVDEVNSIIEDYFKTYPKYLLDDSIDCKVTEIISELLSLYENEQYLIEKRVNYPKAKIVHVAYNKRTEPLTKLDDWLCLTAWSGNLEDRIKNGYNPVEYTVYSEEKDFTIEKCS